MHVIFLPLGNGLFAQVDSDCPSEIWQQKWSANTKTPGRTYAYRTTRVSENRSARTHTTLHVQIAGVAEGEEVDHKNGDTLDDRRQNLRPCLHSENGRNLRKWSSPTSSKFKGVTLRYNGRWMAYIVRNGGQKYIGLFSDEESAARAYDEEAKKLHGEFARLNFPV